MEKIHAVCPTCQAVNAVLPERIRQTPVCAKCATPLLPAHPLDLTDQTFERFVSRSGLPVLVDFWAPWCGPCKMLGPVLEEIAEELQGQLVIGKVNVDENPATPGKYGIRSIPTLMLFKNGQVVSTKVGAVPKAALQAWIKENA